MPKLTEKEKAVAIANAKKRFDNEQANKLIRRENDASRKLSKVNIQMTLKDLENETFRALMAQAEADEKAEEEAEAASATSAKKRARNSEVEAPPSKAKKSTSKSSKDEKGIGKSPLGRASSVGSNDDNVLKKGGRLERVSSVGSNGSWKRSSSESDSDSLVYIFHEESQIIL